MIEESTKPLLLARLGAEASSDYDFWTPEQKDIDLVAKCLDSVFGEHYRIMVFHRGINLEVEDVPNLPLLKQVDITSIRELKKELGLG